MTKEQDNRPSGGETFVAYDHPEAEEYHHAYISGHFNQISPRANDDAPAAQQPRSIANTGTTPKTPGR